MSEIIRQLRNEVDAKISMITQLAQEEKLFAIKAMLDEIAEKVGRRYRIMIQMNFPDKKAILDVSALGLSNLSFFVHRSRKQFSGISPSQVKLELSARYPEARITEVGFGWEGYNVREEAGRIMVLPGAVHFWRRLTDHELGLLDWLFSAVFGRSGQ